MSELEGSNGSQTPSLDERPLPQPGPSQPEEHEFDDWAMI